MPELFDPAWEYFEPDPEIAEALEVHQRFNLWDLVGDDRLAKYENLGMRFGIGNPDHCRFKLARPRPERLNLSRLVYHRNCRTCGTLFLPDRESRWYCSQKCRPHPGKPKSLPEYACARCGVRFQPRTACRKFCSPECSQRSHGGPKSRIDLEVFREMYLSGKPMKEIATAFAVNVSQCQRARRKLGLKPRGPRGSERPGD